MRAFALVILLSCFGLSLADTYDEAVRLLGPGTKMSTGGYLSIRPRGDLQIQNHAGMLIAPEMGLESRIEIDKDRIEGELCLIQPEIGPAIDRLRESGIEIVGLGNRLAGETPAAYFLEFRGEGDGVKLAAGVKSALAELGKDRLINEGLQRTGSYPVVDWKSAEVILGSPIREIGSSRVMAASSGGNSVRFGGCTCGRTQVLVSVACESAQLQKTVDAARSHRLLATSIKRTSQGYSLTFEGEGDALSLAGASRATWLAAAPGS